MPHDIAESLDQDKESAGASGVFPLALAAFIFAAHAITSGAVYFADGPSLVAAVLKGTYVIQPPGYWLFSRLGGMFHNSGFGFAVLNWFFCSSGAAVFYLLCRKLDARDGLSRLASAVYACVFFAWFAGDVHSTYATQMLFPPLLIFTFLCYEERKTRTHLLICAGIFAIGTGFRQSDGFFLLPLFSYLVLRAAPGWKARAQFFLAYGLFCLAWFVPSQIALGGSNAAGQLASVAATTSLLHVGITTSSLLNLLRVLVPLFLAFWPLLLALPFTPKKQILLVLLWVMPGMLFFLLIYMSDAPYLVYASGAPILAVVLCRRRKLAAIALTGCLFWNLAFFFLARPIPGRNKVILVLNYYGIKYTHFGVSHHWMQNISEGLISGPWYEKEE
jgi:hypothetical protein